MAIYCLFYLSHFRFYSPADIAKVGAHSRFGRPKPSTAKKTEDENSEEGDAVPLSIYNIEEENESGEAGKIRKVSINAVSSLYKYCMFG